MHVLRVYNEETQTLEKQQLHKWLNDGVYSLSQKLFQKNIEKSVDKKFKI